MTTPSQEPAFDEENERITIESAQDPVFDLESLIAGITSQNCHEEVECGTPVGKEV